MVTTSFDTITRRTLLENSMPIHFYPEYLYYAASCLRELSFDALKIFNSANLPVDDTGNVTLPDDFVEDISVCIPAGQSLAELPKQDWITPLRIHDSTTGEFDTYDGNITQPETFFGYPFGSWAWFFNVDSFGTPTGRFFGAHGGTNAGYKVLKQQRRIQLSENFIGSNVVLIYISDGQSVDAATQIDPQAFATIQDYINWQKSPNKSNEFSPEARKFYNSRRKLVARLDDLTPTDIVNIIRKNYTATIKN